MYFGMKPTTCDEDSEKSPLTCGGLSGFFGVGKEFECSPKHVDCEGEWSACDTGTCTFKHFDPANHLSDYTSALQMHQKYKVNVSALGDGKACPFHDGAIRQCAETLCPPDRYCTHGTQNLTDCPEVAKEIGEAVKFRHECKSNYYQSFLDNGNICALKPTGTGAPYSYVGIGNGVSCRSGREDNGFCISS